MIEAEASFLHAVSASFLARWTEDYDGEAYTVAEHMLREGDLSLSTPINDAADAVRAFVTFPR